MTKIPSKRWAGASRVQYNLRTARAWSLLLLCALLGAACGPGDAPETATALPNPTPAAESGAALPDPVEAAPSAQSADEPVIVFLGTSLTAGYGLREDEAFPALIQERLRESGRAYRVVNAGVSGDTSAGGLRRLDWLLRLPIAVLVIELGANDMLRGQDIEALRANLEAIVARTREAHPDCRFVIAGMRAAPNLGPEYRQAFDAIYPELAERYDAGFVPFLLEDVAAKRDLNQADGIHPTAEGHGRVAERVWPALEAVLPPKAVPAG